MFKFVKQALTNKHRVPTVEKKEPCAFVPPSIFKIRPARLNLVKEAYAKRRLIVSRFLVLITGIININGNKIISRNNQAIKKGRKSNCKDLI